MRKRRIDNGMIRIVVGERDPKLFLVPKKTAQGVVELLRPYTASDRDSVSAGDAFTHHYARCGKAGTVLRGFRSREGLTQQQLAKRVLVTQGDISAMENGRRPIGKSIASRLAKVFKTDYRVFL